MFLELDNRFAERGTRPRGQVFSYHPAQLMALMDEVWDRIYANQPANFVPTPMIPGLPASLRAPVLASVEPPKNPLVDNKVPLDTYWKHLIYAYLMENTRIVQIFGRVIEKIHSGEQFGALSEETYQWVRCTEELFFRSGNLPLIADLTSNLRAQNEEVRRNAYYRMFGMDLNHAGIDNRPVEFPRPPVANTSFVATWQDLLREVWRGYINVNNSTGIRLTDDSRIAELIEQLKNMFLDRRRSISTGARSYGMLAREEFVSVNTLSWFHLTVDFESPVVRDLKATSSTAEERLRKLGDLVGIPAHSHSRSFIQMATVASNVMRIFERWPEGELSSPDHHLVSDLYTTSPTTMRDQMLTLINHWSIATGADLKALPVSAAPR